MFGSCIKPLLLSFFICVVFFFIGLALVVILVIIFGGVFSITFVRTSTFIGDFSITIGHPSFFANPFTVGHLSILSIRPSPSVSLIDVLVSLATGIFFISFVSSILKLSLLFF
jgi:hypothetical protein